ncbi:MAG: enoyl-CoA hydratase/isomerase family protein [Gaiellales bacterium]
MAVDFSKDRAVGIITLDRPPANSYEIGFVGELAEAISQAARDDDVRAVVVRSASERFFSAGADIKAFVDNSPDANIEMVRAGHRALRAISEVPKVFVAEIAAHALGGGLEIALACDLRFGAEGDYKLGLPEVGLGLLPGNGGTQRLARLIGTSRALDLMVTGRSIGPAEAFELGILDRLVPEADLRSETVAYCERLAAGASLAIAGVKEAVSRGVEESLDAGLEREAALIAELFRSADASEGAAAFVEKRAATFRGR